MLITSREMSNCDASESSRESGVLCTPVVIHRYDLEASAENNTLLNGTVAVTMGKSEESSNLEHRHGNELLGKSIGANASKSIITGINGLCSAADIDGDVGGATGNVGHPNDRVTNDTDRTRSICSDTTSLKLGSDIPYLETDHLKDPQKSPLCGPESLNTSDPDHSVLLENTHSRDGLKRPPLHGVALNECNLDTSSPLTVGVDSNDGQTVSTTSSTTPSLVDRSVNEKSGNDEGTRGAESNSTKRMTDGDEDGFVNGVVDVGVCRHGCSGEEVTESVHEDSTQVIPDDNDVNSVAVVASVNTSPTDTVGRSTNCPDTRGALVTAKLTTSGGDRKLVDKLPACSDTNGVAMTNSLDRPVNKNTGDIVSYSLTKSNSVVSQSSGDVVTPRGSGSSVDSVTQLAGDDVTKLLNCDTGYVKTANNVSLSQDFSSSSESDSNDAVSALVNEIVAGTLSPSQLCIHDDTNKMDVTTPVCDVPLATTSCTKVITVVDKGEGAMSVTVSKSAFLTSDTASDSVTDSLDIPGGSRLHSGGDRLREAGAKQLDSDLIISSSKITKRKLVDPETVAIKKEKIDAGYDETSQGQVVPRVVTVTPVTAPHLAHQLTRNATGKRSVLRTVVPRRSASLSNIQPKPVTMLSVGGNAPRLVLPVNSTWRHAGQGSASETSVILVGPSNSAAGATSSAQLPPVRAVPQPYVFVSDKAGAKAKVITRQSKFTTVTIVAQTPSVGGRAKKVAATGFISKTMSRPDSMKMYKCPRPPAQLYGGAAEAMSTCTACYDTFWHARSLQLHLKRMSVSIRMFCDTCRTQLLFYNRCALLTHMRSHRPGTVDTICLHRAKVAPLPTHFMPPVYWTVCGKPAPPLPTTSGPAHASTPSSVGHVGTTSKYVVVVSPMSQPPTKAVPKSVTPPQEPPSTTQYTCFECDMMFASSRMLQCHLNKKVGDELFRCTACHMVLRNPCRFHAHQRIHTKQWPYICPECGDMIQGNHAVFMKHVRWRCLHLSRTARFQCGSCKSHFDSESLYTDHVSKHAANYYKCLSCPMAFRSADGCEKHNVALHAMKARTQHITKCSYCDTVFQRRANLTEHMAKSHLDELWNTMHYVFRCHHCKQVCVTKYDLIRHLETEHAFKGMPGMCNVCGKEMAVSQLEAHKTKFHAPDQWQCSECSEGFASAVKLIKHSRTHNGNVSTVSLVVQSKSNNDGKEATCECDEQLDYTEPIPEHSCSVCDENFAEHSELTCHLRVKHGIIPQWPCHLCGLTYETEADLKGHIADVHEGKKAVTPPVFTCWLCEDDDSAIRHFKKRRVLISHLATVHRIPKANLDLSRLMSSDASGADGATVTSPAAPAVKRLKTDSDSKFVCAKCDFSGEDRVAFVAHIEMHCTRDNPWQCHECGLCFTVRPSLRRHLFMVHRVKDFERYNEEAGIDLDLPLVDPKQEEEDDELVFGTFSGPTLPLPEPTVATSPSSPTSDKPLECTVCYKQFDDESAKRAHMRTHGMAFIYSRRRITKTVQ